MSRQARLRSFVLLGLAAALIVPATAQASSIVFTRPDGNIWLISPDGSGLYQVTLDGSPGDRYESPSQADDGTIAAARGAGSNQQIYRLKQNGAVLNAFRPAVELGLGLINPKISPDGSKVAYWTGFFGNSTCDVGSSGTTACFSTHVTASTGPADQGVDLVGNSFPSWATASRLLVSGSDNYVSFFDFGQTSATHWFGGGITNIPSDPELAAIGTRIAYTRTVSVANDQLAVQDTAGDPRVDNPPQPLPPGGCAGQNPAGGGFHSPTWSPDGMALAWEESDGQPSTPPGQGEGIVLANVGASVAAFCGSFPNAVLVPGGSDPDWGPANINPGPRSGGGGDRTAPAFQGAVAVGPSTFAAAGRGGSIARARRAPVGTKVRYRLSEAAAVTFTVERPTSGRKVGKRCVAPSRSNRRKRRCTRYVAVRGSFVHLGKAGSNSFKFTGRMAGRKLSPGSYQLVAVAKDAAGNRSAQKRASFRVVRG